MSDWIHIDKDPRHIAREKAKAGVLRKTQWWRDKLNQGICHYCNKKMQFRGTYYGSRRSHGTWRKKYKGKYCTLLQRV